MKINSLEIIRNLIAWLETSFSEQVLEVTVTESEDTFKIAVVPKDLRSCLITVEYFGDPWIEVSYSGFNSEVFIDNDTLSNLKDSITCVVVNGVIVETWSLGGDIVKSVVYSINSESKCTILAGRTSLKAYLLKPWLKHFRNSFLPFENKGVSSK